MITWRSHPINLQNYYEQTLDSLQAFFQSFYKRYDFNFKTEKPMSD